MGDDEEYHLLVIDLRTVYPVALIQVQGTSDGPNIEKLKEVEIYVGRAMPQPTTTDDKRNFVKEPGSELSFCGKWLFQQTIPQAVFLIPCRCVIGGRYVGVRIRGPGAQLIRLGVWQTSF